MRKATGNMLEKIERLGEGGEEAEGEIQCDSVVRGE